MIEYLLKDENTKAEVRLVYNNDPETIPVEYTLLSDDDELLKAGYYPSYDSSISRSLYIDNVLYTVSNKMVKMNDLGDISKINSVLFQ